MESVALALTAIVGIAVTNLFLGFAAALLIGRGPKNWSDVDSVIVIRRFSLRLLVPGLRRAILPGAVGGRVSTADKASNQRHDAASADRARSTVTGGSPRPISLAKSPAFDAAAQRLVLKPHAADGPSDERPAEQVLADQLETWRTSEPREDVPCLSGLQVTVQPSDLGSEEYASLHRSVHAKIMSQLRKDRRVLRTADHQFIWLSLDVHPDDALQPVERIRQLLERTRFHQQEHILSVSVQAGIVAVSDQDRPADLVRRLHDVLAHAAETRAGTTLVDRGHGPEAAEPQRMDIEFSDCQLD